MKFNPNRYDLILLFAVVSGIYYVMRKWAHAGGAAAWRRAERLKQARWQLEVDEYRVAHGLVGDAE